MQQEQLVNEIARLVAEQLKGMDLYNPNDRIPIGVSARHVHLTRKMWRSFSEKAISSIKRRS